MDNTYVTNQYKQNSLTFTDDIIVDCEHKYLQQNFLALCLLLVRYLPASVAQLDARPTGDQEVAGLTPPRSATFFRGDWSWSISTVILSLPLIQEGQLSVSGERMCTILVNRLEY